MKLRTPLAALLVLWCASAFGQEMFPGTNLPITVKPSELGGDFRPLKLKEQSAGAFGDYYSGIYFQAASIGLRSEPGGRVQELLEILQVSWTRSEMVKVYGQDYIVTYILEPSLDDLKAFSEGKPLRNPMLKLKLMKADQIGSIEPFPELTREGYLALLDRFSATGLPAMSSDRKMAALSNAKQCTLGFLMWQADNDDLFPYAQSSPQALMSIRPYIKNDDIWLTMNPAKSNGRFRFNMSLAGASAADIEAPAETPMLYDPLPWPDGTILVGFTDGHAKFVSKEAWDAMQPLLKLKLKRHGKPLGPFDPPSQAILGRVGGG